MNKEGLENAKFLLSEYPLERAYIYDDSFGFIDGASLLDVLLYSYKEERQTVYFFGPNLVCNYEDDEGKYSGYGVEVRYEGEDSWVQHHQRGSHVWDDYETWKINHGIF